MKKWQKNFMAIVVALGFTEQIKGGKLSADEQKQIFKEYQEKFGVSFEDDKKANEDALEETADALSAEEISTIAKLMGVSEETVPPVPKAAAKTAAEKAAENAELAKKAAEQIAALKAEEDKPKPKTVTVEQNKFNLFRAHSAAHLFGVDDNLYSLKNGENRIMLDKKPYLMEISGNKKERAAFLTRLETFSDKVSERIDFMNKNSLFGALDFNAQIKGESGIDYSELFNTAGEYIVRRTDLILAYLRQVPTVRNIFPVLSGVQNKMIAPLASFSELSQGYRKGRIFKGNVKFAAEMYKVDAVMFKYDFEDLIELERQYIGYLNREGSSVFKWTFIEWILIHFGQKLQNEQNIRNVRGYAVPQQDVLSNPFEFAADGALRAIQRAVEEYKVLPFYDYGTYDKNSMLDVVEEIWDKFSEYVNDTATFRIYANARHESWYKRAFRQKYGQDTDFAGAQNSPMVDLDPNKIVWVPNMLINDYTLWITIPYNVELLEHIAGEMHKYDFTKEFESVLAFSRWKEGAHVQQAGIKFASKAELEANEYKEQILFVNYPTTNLTLAASIDVKANSHYKVTGTTAVSSVVGANPAVVYKFEAAAAGVKIVKSGVFSKINSLFEANAEGDWLKVYAELEDVETVIDGETVTRTQPTGKFLELDRRVSEA
ncbi:MAG: hypothetical protein LBS50_10240 [Prevotellaceae bacterium]|jgi:5'-3' exonuclease|nr:hypothetical protein [Prevotellaceae bacterium]